MKSVKNTETLPTRARYFPDMAESRAPLGPKIRRPIKDFLDEVIAEEMADQRGMQQWCVEAALLHFLDASPDVRREYVMRVRDAELHAGTKGMVDEIKARRKPKHPTGFMPKHKKNAAPSDG